VRYLPQLPDRLDQLLFPTGWHGTELAGLQAGDRVAVFGAGPPAV
jgi:threonine dehydrogenase-like Zn-dependent dehydrogenase